MPNKKLKPLGVVTHYFGKIGVAVLKLNGPLAAGEEIILKHGDIEIPQVVHSMQIDHEPVAKAKKGDDIAIKVDQKVTEGTLVIRPS